MDETALGEMCIVQEESERRQDEAGFHLSYFSRNLVEGAICKDLCN